MGSCNEQLLQCLPGKGELSIIGSIRCVNGGVQIDGKKVRICGEPLSAQRLSITAEEIEYIGSGLGCGCAFLKVVATSIEVSGKYGLGSDRSLVLHVDCKYCEINAKYPFGVSSSGLVKAELLYINTQGEYSCEYNHCSSHPDDIALCYAKRLISNRKLELPGSRGVLIADEAPSGLEVLGNFVVAVRTPHGYTLHYNGKSRVVGEQDDITRTIREAKEWGKYDGWKISKLYNTLLEMFQHH